MSSEDKRTSPIGVFDSGIGGLTVYKALRAALPHEDFIYLGDTAHLPYGTKSPEAVLQYTVQAARELMENNIKLLVIACNTATAVALPSLPSLLEDLPCLGVIDPGAQAAAKTSITGRIAVLATEGTVKSGAYAAAIKHYRPDAHIQMLACNLLVALVEEGWSDGAEADAIISRYLSMLQPDFDVLVLGCTHFPLLASTIRKHLPASVQIIDSASTTAIAVETFLVRNDLLRVGTEVGKTSFYVTNAPERFERLAERFLGYDINVENREPTNSYAART